MVPRVPTLGVTTLDDRSEPSPTNAANRTNGRSGEVGGVDAKRSVWVYANLLGAAIAQDRARARMAAMVEEKEALLRELQHRIKNNLATVTGLVRLQSCEARHPETVAQLGKIGQRIETLRLVHERLYKRAVGERVALRPILEELVANIGAFHEAGRRGVEIEVRVEDHDVDADLAIPVGLLINEFATNSFKHAFGEGGGRVAVRLAAEGDALRLEMADDGPGLSPGLTHEAI